MPEQNANNSWGEWSKFVLKELERLNENIEAMHKEIRNIEIQLTALQIKAGLWGAVAGAIPAAVTLIYFLLQR